MTFGVVIGLTFMVMLVAVAGMAVGAMISGRRLRGSCGGVGANGGDCLCDREGRPRDCESAKRGPSPLVELPRGRR